MGVSYRVSAVYTRTHRQSTELCGCDRNYNMYECMHVCATCTFLPHRRVIKFNVVVAPHAEYKWVEPHAHSFHQPAARSCARIDNFSLISSLRNPLGCIQAKIAQCSCIIFRNRQNTNPLLEGLYTIIGNDQLIWIFIWSVNFKIYI
jgi:hypothetical protein